MRLPYILVESVTREGLIHIGKDEASHLAKVLRARPGFRFIGFDGKGQGWEGEWEGSRPGGGGIARVVQPLPYESETKPSVTLAVGIVKGPRMDWAVEKAAELGVERFLTFHSRFGVVEPGARRLARWKSIAIAAAKQSRRLRLMEVCPPVDFELLIRNFGSEHPAGSVLALDLLPESVEPGTAQYGMTSFDRTTFVIGPEGGFSDDERSIIRKAGIPSISLGRHPLRTETAVVAAATLGFNPMVRFAR